MPAEQIPAANPADTKDSFDCLATATVLHGGSLLTRAAHIAALAGLLPLSKGGTPAWIAAGSLLVWCAVVYLSIRVDLDARFFQMLASRADAADHLDSWLASAGLAKARPPRSVAERRRGALRWWRILAVAVALQIALMIVSMTRFLA